MNFLFFEVVFGVIRFYQAMLEIFAGNGRARARTLVKVEFSRSTDDF
jgi:hypothetical protein